MRQPAAETNPATHLKMGERKHSGSYEVSDGPPVVMQSGWCGTRFMVFMTMICSFIIYIIGSIITGFGYRSESYYVNCTNDKYQSVKMIGYHTPMVVVGPCLMSAGGSILLYLLLQWFLCRPSLK
ncbi:uncharacterized protein LOC127006990 [Eriocheir sinensis]|uniref:uncharacterized protein LOC127006990 n=1 Tax=Eriocheir sinensis TaxID=95602 RepID=UPI0021C8CE7B|nr:uncharacterized protein LOC127006990 [Eriocheir sinensis]